jgi:hypothetical protein
MNWHILDPQGNSMEVTEAQLSGIARAGQITPDTLVWRDGLPEWIPAASALPHLFAAAPPPPPPPPRSPAAPRPPARRVATSPPPAKKGGCLKWGLISAGLLFATFVAISIFSPKTPRGPGADALNEAESHLKGKTTSGYGDSKPEREAATVTAEIAQSLRSSGIAASSGSSGRGKSGLFRRAAAAMDSDGFTSVCSVRGDTAVFLIHVPDLRKFNDEAKVAMGQWSWAAARVGWSQLPEPRPAKLAVALKGALLYDRLLKGSAKPLDIADDNAEVTDAILQAGLDSTIDKPSDITKALEEIFTEPASLSSKQDSKADSKPEPKQDPKPDQKPDPAPASNP